MSISLAQKFMEALRILEDDKDAEPLAALYADDARIGNVISPEKFHGTAGARQFWTEYRGAFNQVQSKFRSVIAGDSGAALEWTTGGTSAEGRSFHYSGVTILEIEDGRIIRSAAYFDPVALGRQIEAQSKPLL